MFFDWFCRLEGSRVNHIRSANGKKKRAHPRLRLEQLEDRITPVVIGSFAGLVEGAAGLASFPPDTVLAASTTNEVEAVNLSYEVLTRGGGPVAPGAISLKTFFSTLPHFNANDSITDPYVVYDDTAATPRFLMGVEEFYYNSMTPKNSYSYYDLAVSPDGSGTGTWTQYQINVSEATVNDAFNADFPKIGFNKDAVVVTFNQFAYSTFIQNVPPDHVLVLSLNASSLFSGTLTSYMNDQPVQGTGTIKGNDTTLFPAQMHGSSAGNPMYFVETSPTTPNTSNNTMLVFTATGLLSSSPIFTPYSISVDAYTETPNQIFPNAITQIDSRVVSVDWRNNNLVAAHTIGLSADTRAHARWYEFAAPVNGSSPSLSLEGTVSNGTSGNAFYPSVAQNTQGDVGMTFEELDGAGSYLSMAVTERLASDPNEQMDFQTLTQVGLATLNSGYVYAVNITNGGSGYTSPPTVTFSAPPPGGRTATGTATINGSGTVTGVIITDGGFGYGSPPTVTFSAPPSGVTATGTASIVLRAGDYSATVMDPVDGRTFWAANEYAQSNGNWGTAIAYFGPLKGQVSFAIASDSTLYVHSDTGWSHISTGNFQLISAGTDDSGDPAVYAVLSNNQLWGWSPTHGWVLLSTLSFQFTSGSISAGANGTLFAVATTGLNLYEHSGTWGVGLGWSNSLRANIRSVSAGTDNNGQLAAYAITNDTPNQMWAWRATGWVQLSTGTGSWQSISAGPSGTLFAVFTDGELWEHSGAWVIDMGWNKRSTSTGDTSIIATVSAGTDNTGQVAVYAVTSNNHMWAWRASGWVQLSNGTVQSSSGSISAGSGGTLFAVFTGTGAGLWQHSGAWVTDMGWIALSAPAGILSVSAVQ